MGRVENAKHHQQAKKCAAVRQLVQHGAKTSAFNQLGFLGFFIFFWILKFILINFMFFLFLILKNQTLIIFPCQIAIERVQCGAHEVPECGRPWPAGHGVEGEQRQQNAAIAQQVWVVEENWVY